MRTIKFRGKRVDNGEWVYGDLIHGQGLKYGKTYILPNSHIYPAGCNELDGWNVKPETVGQFTGLFDKNGAEIYERDIAIVKASLNENEHILPLIYKDGCFVFWSDEQNQGIVLHKLSLDRIEVIGNIHDNPELLKTK